MFSVWNSVQGPIFLRFWFKFFQLVDCMHFLMSAMNHQVELQPKSRLSLGLLLRFDSGVGRTVVCFGCLSHLKK